MHIISRPSNKFVKHTRKERVKLKFNNVSSEARQKALKGESSAKRKWQIFKNNVYELLCRFSVSVFVYFIHGRRGGNLPSPK